MSALKDLCTARRAAGVVVGLAFATMLISLVRGHSAQAEAPLDLQPATGEVGLDVWKTVALLGAHADAVVVDRRSDADFALWHVPGSVHAPGADAAALVKLKSGHGALVLVAGKDAVAETVVAEARKADCGECYFLRNGARAWYLAFDLPVGLFSDEAAPPDYAKSLETVRTWLEARAPDGVASVQAAVQVLARLNVQPTALQTVGKAKGGGKKKKISGGCG